MFANQLKIKSCTYVASILNTVILSAVFHEHQIQRLQCFVMHCLRIILGVSVRDMKLDTTLQKMVKQQGLSSLLMQRRLLLLVRLSQMDDSHLPEQLLVCAPVGRSRAVGGQKYQWNDIVSRDLTTSGLSKDWRERAPSQDTVQWETKREVEAINVQAGWKKRNAIIGERD